MHVNDRWLTIQEAMDYSRVKNRKTIMKWISLGLIYAHKRTGSWIVDKESIDKWFLEDNLEPIRIKNTNRSVSLRKIRD